MFDLSDRTAIVTGASQGIGKSIAGKFAEYGADVVVNYPSDDKRADAEAIVEKIQSGDTIARAIRADVSDAVEVRGLFETAERTIGTPDVVVNNAGIGSAMPIEDIAETEWDRVIDVNLKGVFLCSQAAVRMMQASESDPGRIINIASQLAFSGEQNMVHYCASKGGIVSFTRALAREVAPAITVNAIAPGPVHTPLLNESTSETWRADKRKEIPLGRIAETDDIAPSAVFLASDAGSYYTGQTLSPDGGDAMH